MKCHPKPPWLTGITAPWFLVTWPYLAISEVPRRWDTGRWVRWPGQCMDCIWSKEVPCEADWDRKGVVLYNVDKQRVLMHGHQGWNVRHGLCHVYMRYVYIYIWVVYGLCLFCCLFITVTWWYVWCIEWASGNQEEVQACLVILWLFIMSCYSLYKTTLGLLCSWFENNPHFHKYSMDFHVQCVCSDKFFLWETWLQ